ncbi:flagellar hook-associated protein 3 FlgL [Jatrophihabitans endophyticus]|uniref:Flagellar hook-associated protein 3 FlgL n=1 Tax=Jatrophihabitans endophyticus TaxID=1206085 RepID=A0A1M5IEI8_9ACTN|nr:flagellar hook-associated protein FlgL [Jatrophihabitans endophyticus]SHG26499.1 flagellar hook-associated protein 3 FlgL [Jatrophihabitans endophyticus]
MNVTRVTLIGQSSQSLSNVQSAAARLASMQNQLSSGKRITTSSDDPGGTVTAMGLRSTLSRSDQYADASSDALAWLSTAESAYSQSVDVLTKARTLVVQALNSGTNDASSNAAMAAQLDGLRSTLLTMANSSYDGRPVFGGTTAGSVAYDASGSYVGDDGTVARVIAPRTTVSVAATGPQVFGSDDDGTSVFTMLSQLSDTLRNSPGSLTGTALDDMDAALSRVSSAQAAEGSTYQQVQRVTTARTTSDSSVTARLSEIEQVDYADMAIKTASANLAYNASIQTTANIGRHSLLDFLS